MKPQVRTMAGERITCGYKDSLQSVSAGGRRRRSLVAARLRTSRWAVRTRPASRPQSAARLDAGLISEGMLHVVERTAEQDQLYQDHPETRVRNVLADSTPRHFSKT